jgi:hypothetical protein
MSMNTLVFDLTYPDPGRPILRRRRESTTQVDSPQAVRQSMQQMLWKPALGSLCSSLNSWSAEDAAHAKQDALIGALSVAVAPPVGEVMLPTAGLYETTSKVEEQGYSSICQ